MSRSVDMSLYSESKGNAA